METLLGKDWITYYPEVLTPEEKAEIRSALLKNFQNGNNPLQDLRSYLQAMKLLTAYPASCQC